MVGSKFFGGNPSRYSYKYVAPLPCGSFREFFESQLWVPVKLALPASDYAALDQTRQKRAKAVRFYTPGAFRETDRSGLYPKNAANVESIALVCIDIDDASEADPIFSDPLTLWDMLDGLNFCVYTTLNHTPQTPRLRVVVEAAAFAPEHYPEAVNHVAGLLGLSELNSESQVPSQAMYRPTVFSDNDGANPVLLHNTKGRALPLEDFLGKTKFLNKGQRSKPTIKGGILDGLEFLQPRIDGITLEDVGEALNAIRPDCSMMDWIRCAMALRHQFPEDDGAAFELFDNWSSGGQTYEGTEKTRYRWEHTHANTLNRLPTTVKTIFKLAKDAGWNSSEKEEDRFLFIKSWIWEQKTVGGLVEPGLNKIAASPLLTSVYKEALVKEMVKAAKKLGFDSSPSNMAKRLRGIESLIKDRQRKQEENEKGIPEWVKGLIYVTRDEIFYRYQTGEKISRSSFDSTYGKNLLPTEKELEERGDTSRQSKNTPVLRPQDFVLNELQIPCAYEDIYDPKNADDYLTIKAGVRYVNTYRRSFANAKPGLAKSHGQVIKNHIALLIHEPEYQRVLLDFIAFMVQHPGEKIRWAFLLQSAQGNGKGLIAKILRGVLGRGNVKTVDPGALFSNFNDWAYGAQLSILNEIRVTGHSRHDVMDKLKEPIADDHVSLNQKFKDNREIENVTNYLMFTNHRDALALEIRERRYFVIFSPLQTDQDIYELNQSGKLKPLQDLVDSGEFGGCRAFFEDWEISKSFCPNSPPPRTKYFDEMAKITKSDLESIFDDLLLAEDNPMIQKDLISASSLLSCVNAELVRPVSPKTLNSLLTAQNYYYLGRFSVYGERHQLWAHRNEAFDKADNFQEIFDKRTQEIETMNEMESQL